MNSVKNTFNHSSVQCPVDVKLSLKLEAEQQNIRLYFMMLTFPCYFRLFLNRKSVTIKTSAYFFVVHLATWMQRDCVCYSFGHVFPYKVNNYRIPAVRCLFHRFCIVSHTFIANRSTKTSHILSLCCENERVMHFF